MATNISTAFSTTEGFMQLSHEYRRLTLHYDLFDKHRSRMSCSSAFGSAKSRDLSMPNGTSSILHTDGNLSFGTILKSVNPEVLSQAKQRVHEAIMNNKIFTIYGPYDKVRNTLKSRGWVEKIVDGKVLSNMCRKFSKSVENKKNGFPASPKQGDCPSNNKSVIINADLEEELDAIASLLVLNCLPDLIWSLRLTQIDDHSLKPNQMINHFKKAGSFTTKIGLIKSFNFLCWYEKVNDDVFPRSYILSDENEKKAFLDDYYLTACMGLIKLTSQADISIPEKGIEEKNESDFPITEINNSKYELSKVKPLINYDNKQVGDSKNKIDRRYPEMALHYCEFYLKYYTNKDLDQRQVVFCSVKRWEEFFDNYYYVTNEGYGIDSTDSIRERSKYLCKEFKKIHPQFNLDGTKNIWIVKPGAKSRGRGIFCASKFSEINDVVRTTSETLIVQKYIENPLLVYKTKFDIRQWFLVTDWSPLTIWWYNDSYIRFCSQQFTLNDFNESVHLSNNSIQYKYQNGTRSKYLPTHNMWEWKSLESYLDNNGYKDGWKNKILPAMKEIIIDILLCSQEEIEDRKNSFELYGADFMVTADDLKTWLLEINSSPCMAASTDITAKLTKSVLEDVMKVLLDYPQDAYCDTGQFELLFKQSPFSKPIVTTCEKLTISGIGIKKPANTFPLCKREVLSPKKVATHEDNGILRNKIKQIAENFHNIRHLSRYQYTSGQSTDHRLQDSNMYPVSINVRNKQIEEHKSHNMETAERRSRSHNPENSLKYNSFAFRQNASKSYLVPTLSNSLDDTQLDKSYKNYARCLDPIKKSNADDSLRLSCRQNIPVKVIERPIRLTSLNTENTLTSKVQNWRQMDKNQRIRHLSLQLQRRIS